MSIKVAFTGIAVADLPSALTWYERLMGRQPDMIPNDNEAVWQLLGEAWLYIIRDAHRAGKTLIMLIADDLDGHVAEFNDRGIPFEFVEKDSKIYRRVAVTDPEGTRFQFTELTSEEFAADGLGFLALGSIEVFGSLSETRHHEICELSV